MGPRSKVNSSLGKSIIRKRFEGKKRPTENDTELHTTELNDGPSWTKLQSITQQGDLEEFLHTAELAGTEFTAERMNIKIITSRNHAANPYLLTAAEEKETLERHRENLNRLKIPRRPEWDSTTTPGKLHRDERDSFMNWRRELAKMQDEEGLLLTPFERNLEIWRQLWRVLERSHLVVQIVDARNPTLFRSRDLEDYVHEIDNQKRCILLINKADMLTERQRGIWADYFEKNNIKYVFFSAKESNERLEEEREREEAEKLARELSQHTINEKDDEDNGGSVADALKELERQEEERRRKRRVKESKKITADNESAMALEEQKATAEFENVIKSIELTSSELRTRVLTPAELVSLLMRECPQIADEHSHNKLMIGLVGYPNVGKSSTINALVGSKRVNVGSMPGKTKHFQTIHLTSDVVLCDCPGLVFPTFATTKADMVCNGVLPIDQLREFTGPSALVAKRFPKWVLEALYGIEIRTQPEEEGGDGIPTAEELLTSYAAARGFFKSGEGNPDESRAARAILKDYVNGKLVYCQPPPGYPDPMEFNKEHFDPVAIAKRTRHLVETEEGEGTAASGDFVVKHAASDRKNVKKAVISNGSVKVDSVDRQFFGVPQKMTRAQKRAMAHQIKHGDGFSQTHVGGTSLTYVNDRGESKMVSGVEAARQAALAYTGNAGKKQHKKKKGGKQRSGDGLY